MKHRLAHLNARLSRVREHRRASAELLASDRDALDLVAYNLMLAVQAAADIACDVVAREGWTTPATITECFDRLAQHDVITTETAAALRRAIGYRNLVLHDYAELDVAVTHAAATAGVDELDQFAREVTTWLTRSPE